MSNKQVTPPSQAGDLTAEEVERIFSVMNSEPVQALRALLADGAERLADSTAV